MQHPSTLHAFSVAPQHEYLPWQRCSSTVTCSILHLQHNSTHSTTAQTTPWRYQPVLTDEMDINTASASCRCRGSGTIAGQTLCEDNQKQQLLTCW